MRPLITWPAVGLLPAIAKRNAMQYDYVVDYGVNDWLGRDTWTRLMTSWMLRRLQVM